MYNNLHASFRNAVFMSKTHLKNPTFKYRCHHVHIKHNLLQIPLQTRHQSVDAFASFPLISIKSQLLSIEHLITMALSPLQTKNF
jgi:hypothetical protein